jgi:hypothetical protein
MQGGFATVVIDGKTVARGWTGSEEDRQAGRGHVHLEQGKRAYLDVGYRQDNAGPLRMELIWSKYDPKPNPEAVESVRMRT